MTTQETPGVMIPLVNGRHWWCQRCREFVDPEQHRPHPALISYSCSSEVPHSHSVEKMVLNTPVWVVKLMNDAHAYMLREGMLVRPIPEIRCRRRRREGSAGGCGPWHISLRLGRSRAVARWVVLHEFAHAMLPWGEKHSPLFWDLAWKLYRWAGVPLRLALLSEGRYRAAARTAYYRSLGKRPPIYKNGEKPPSAYRLIAFWRSGVYLGNVARPRGIPRDIKAIVDFGRVAHA